MDMVKHLELAKKQMKPMTTLGTFILRRWGAIGSFRCFLSLSAFDLVVLPTSMNTPAPSKILNLPMSTTGSPSLLFYGFRSLKKKLKHLN
uniref:Uncharacterized protein n=1 Tax=Steinernema glaseri TaxID=37863 RepID=A0A1I8AVB5_9BILA